MPTHEELRSAEVVLPLSMTNGVPAGDLQRYCLDLCHHLQTKKLSVDKFRGAAGSPESLEAFAAAFGSSFRIVNKNTTNDLVRDAVLFPYTKAF